MAILTIIRGTPGSGKSSFAKDHFNCLHLEADMLFERDGEYKWNDDDRGKNHTWCQNVCDGALALGMDVVVSNTFTTRKEIVPYQKMAEARNASFRVIKCIGRHKNTHNVPEDVLKNMTERWQNWDGEIVASPNAPRNAPMEECLLSKGCSLIEKMTGSKLVRVKDLPDGIQSLNYNRKAFYNGKWTEETKHARGLFLRGANVVARSFDKFFRIGEVQETSLKALTECIVGKPVKVCVARKYNGYLGIVSWDDEYSKWRFFSKSSTENTYSERFREIVTDNGFLKYIDDIRVSEKFDNMTSYPGDKKSKVVGRSFVFEVVDNLNDPHFVLNDDMKRTGMAYLIGVYDNEIYSDGMTPPEIASEYGFGINPWLGQYRTFTNVSFSDPATIRESLYTIANDRMWSAINTDAVPNYEGAVISVTESDGSVFRFKVKAANYCFWKHVRRFVESPSFDYEGYLDVDTWHGRENELLEPRKCHYDMIGKLCRMRSDDLTKFMITDLGGHERIDMIQLIEHLTGENK